MVLLSNMLQRSKGLVRRGNLSSFRSPYLGTRNNNIIASSNNIVERLWPTCIFEKGSCMFSTTSAESVEEKPLIPGIGKGKTSTGLVGLAVEPDWYNIILKKFQLLLDRLDESDMPVTAQYRINVTKWCNYVLKVTKENPDDPEAVEDLVNMGQVEELIEMADDEMSAMDTYLETRMWELVEENEPVIEFDPDPMEDPMAEGGDPDVQENIRKGLEDDDVKK